MDDDKYVAIRKYEGVPNELCKNCPKSNWLELYGEFLFCCDMSCCIADDDFQFK